MTADTKKALATLRRIARAMQTVGSLKIQADIVNAAATLRDEITRLEKTKAAAK